MDDERTTRMPEDEGWRSAALAAVDAWGGRLRELSHSLHAEPETAFAEHRSAAKITALLAEAGFTVERGVAGMETAFVARYGTGELRLALCAEYDALPGLGHACGHNVNGAASVGAGLGLAAVAAALDLTVEVVGTPAEEDAGGKVLLLDAGVFADTAAAMMVHAGPRDTVRASSLAVGAWDVVYRGRPSHAALAPWEGVNALDAFTVAHTALGMLRQQLPPGALVHTVLHEAGTAVNIVPALALGRCEMRAPDAEQLAVVRERVRACFEAGALATGATLELVPHGEEFADMRQDEALSSAYERAARSLGRFPEDLSGRTMASTDMGNISRVLPSIHPTIGYATAGAEPHTAAFAAYGTSPQADAAVLDGAKALALTAAEIAATTHERQRLLHALSLRRAPHPGAEKEPDPREHH
ncbi:M20 family metallopeptidase [Streptomyces sp. NPDC001255]|uniref:M20 family metallopeptidase n=1 Tax=Streptomyces sp. NPDC001255 TaxID=3364550 RepID=UPI003683AAC7